MLLKKEGFPEEDELVLCTVTAVQSHSVFCKLDEYEKQGMINISEVAPGRIRNIRDYVVEGKKIVCQVLRVDKEKGYIDLSLRRVSETQRKKKLNEIKQEQLAEKIVEQVAKQRDEPLEVLYKKVRAVLKDWPNLFPAFEKVAKRELSLEKVGFEPELARQLEEVILTRIKPPQKILEGILTLTSYASNGIQLIKETLLAGLIPGITITYSGAGKYRIVSMAPEPKEAERLLKESVARMISIGQDKKLVIEFKRID